MIGPTEQSSVKVANELLVTHQKCRIPLGSKGNTFLKRRMKDQDPVENNARVINILTLSKLLVLNELGSLKG